MYFETESMTTLTVIYAVMATRSRQKSINIFYFAMTHMCQLHTGRTSSLQFIWFNNIETLKVECQLHKHIIHVYDDETNATSERACADTSETKKNLNQ